MKLKTLKDIKKRCVGIELVFFDLFKEKTKQEAIKWVKEDFGDGWSAFKKFMNITEEDLK